MTNGNKAVLTLAGACIVLACAARYQGAQRELVVREKLTPVVVEHTQVVERVAFNPTTHPVYNYSLIPGGVENVDDFCEQIQFDAAFMGFNCAYAREIHLTNDIRVFMTFRKDGLVRWTRKPVLVRGGERVYTDGTRSFLARCANEIRFTPQEPSMEVETSELQDPEVPHASNVPALPSQPSVPAPHNEASTTQTSRSGWAGLAAIPVVIWHGSSNSSVTNNTSVSKCDPIETGCP